MTLAFVDGNFSFCVPYDFVGEIVLKRDAITLSEVTFALGMIWGLFLAYLYMRYCYHATT